MLWVVRFLARCRWLVSARRYLEIVSELLLTVKQMENTLSKRRITARRGSRLSVGDQGPSDRDKIMMQVSGARAGHKRVPDSEGVGQRSEGGQDGGRGGRLVASYPGCEGLVALEAV